MKKTALLLGTTILLLVNLSAQGTKSTGTKPVDEGQKNAPKEDTTKGAEDVNNSYEYQSKSLEKMKSTFVLRREKISHAPFTLLKYDNVSKKITTLSVENSSVNSINFNVEKSNLKVGDRVLVINNRDSAHKHAPKGKEVIIEVEILE